MTQRDRRAGFAPGTVGLQGERVDVVILPTTNIELLPIWIESYSGKCVRQGVMSDNGLRIDCTWCVWFSKLFEVDFSNLNELP